jgi:hypothetical protein
MLPAQLVALRDPCFLGEETYKPKFGRRLLVPRDDVTVILTMNIGDE